MGWGRAVISWGMKQRSLFCSLIPMDALSALPAHSDWF
ncbi:hypothetical Protein YC6258_03415 [Gynuella sunshinyii YC6258]|uniref:Uncharacterized protein n=1 Tax=Gynuella sunshinyii YC6258 TaxID=1445510 RepID=A0A0C5VL73_9GAMM|nr:hypothetical Protein YC6258_03415 [Gynuella sunshinyii YC6258]